jgi:hypothetical protein
MPLYARPVAEHYPGSRSASADSFVILSGSLEVGNFHRIAVGPSEGRWSWGAGFGVAVAGFTASGYAKSPEECRIYIASAFRRMLARADLRERADARPGPPRRKQAPAPEGPSGTLPPYDRTNDILRGPMLRPERRITIRSGELIVGLLTRSTHGPERWWWALTGVERPDDEGFVWRGDAATEMDAFDQLELSWARWAYWAGLESVAPLQRGARQL